MIPSSAEVAERLRKHAEEMAKEIASRVVQDVGQFTHGRDIFHSVERQAFLTLMDWYLGDYIPGAPPNE